jgi:hypothetical protein
MVSKHGGFKVTLPNHDTYNAPVLTVRGYNGKRGTKHSPLSSLANVAIVRAAFPDWSRLEHARRAIELKALGKTAGHEHGELWRAAFMRAFGRQPKYFEYRISGIGNDDLAESDKTELRRLAVLAGEALHLAYWHSRAAGVMAMRNAARS